MRVRVRIPTGFRASLDPKSCFPKSSNWETTPRGRARLPALARGVEGGGAEADVEKRAQALSQLEAELQLAYVIKGLVGSAKSSQHARNQSHNRRGFARLAPTVQGARRE